MHDAPIIIYSNLFYSVPLPSKLIFQDVNGSQRVVLGENFFGDSSNPPSNAHANCDSCRYSLQEYQSHVRNLSY